MINLNRPLNELKPQLLAYFRARAAESLQRIIEKYGDSQYKKRAAAINRQIAKTETFLISNLLQLANRQQWQNETIINKILMINYTRNIVMLESRNDVWPYDYMAFSRRIGELWEPFCKQCFAYPLNEIELFIPPLFSQVKQALHAEIENYIDQLAITPAQRLDLKRYYQKVWRLAAAGEVQLELDLHFISAAGRKINVDFKSGFSSNEKGNTNRLLMVAAVYQSLDTLYDCVILVRSEEDKNNHYLQTLKNSAGWNAYCGNEAYRKIHEYSGFDLKSWIETYIDWKNDFRADTLQHFRDNDLVQYLSW